MQPEPATDIESRLRNEDGIQTALRQAAEDARQLHIRAGVPAVGCRNGRIVFVNPVDLTEIEAARDSA